MKRTRLPFLCLLLCWSLQWTGRGPPALVNTDLPTELSPLIQVLTSSENTIADAPRSVSGWPSPSPSWHIKLITTSYKKQIGTSLCERLVDYGRCDGGIPAHRLGVSVLASSRGAGLVLGPAGRDLDHVLLWFNRRRRQSTQEPIYTVQTASLKRNSRYRGQFINFPREIYNERIIGLLDQLHTRISFP